MAMTEMFQCKWCKDHKTIEEFAKHPGCRNGIDTGRCLKCKNAMSKASYHNSSREQKIFNRARSRSVKKGVPFTLDINLIEVPEVCPVFGTPFEEDYSIDRMEPHKGYTPDNVNIISLRANVVKGNATLEELEAIVAWMKSKKEVL